KLVGRQSANYFRKRGEWRVTDMLKNPRLLMMMILPLLFIFVLPKLINKNDPELQRVSSFLSPYPPQSITIPTLLGHAKPAQSQVQSARAVRSDDVMVRWRRCEKGEANGGYRQKTDLISLSFHRSTCFD